MFNRALCGAVLVVGIALSVTAVRVDTCSNYIYRPQFECGGGGGDERGLAIEVRNTVTSMISVAAEPNPMSYEEYLTYPDIVGIYDFNTPRNLFFNNSCLFKSPNQPMDCTNTGEEGKEPCLNIKPIKVFNDTTWLDMALAVCAQYYPSLDTNVTLGPPPPGQVMVGPINKCQNMTFTAPEAYFMTDEWGNKYIMHASSTNTTEALEASVEAVVLPPGWSLAKEALDGPFTLVPTMDETGACYYTNVRDSSDNSYHLMGCSGSTYPADFNPACPAGVKSPGAAAASPSDSPSTPPKPSKPTLPSPSPVPTSSPPAPTTSAAAGVGFLTATAAAAVVVGALAL